MPSKGLFFPALCTGSQWRANQIVRLTPDGKVYGIEPFSNESEGIRFIDGIGVVLDIRAEHLIDEITSAFYTAVKGLPPFEGAAKIIAENLYAEYKTDKVENSVLAIVECSDNG